MLSAAPEHAAKLQRLSQIQIQQQVVWMFMTVFTSQKKEAFDSGCTDDTLVSAAVWIIVYTTPLKLQQKKKKSLRTFGGDT